MIQYKLRPYISADFEVGDKIIRIMQKNEIFERT